jgi:hypothetical protein
MKPQPPLSGLKARATLAWGNAPGHNPLTPQRAESPRYPSLGQRPRSQPLTLSGLKAHATLAWGNAPGHNPLTLSGLKARATLAWGSHNP